MKSLQKPQDKAEEVEAVLQLFKNKNKSFIHIYLILML